MCSAVLEREACTFGAVVVHQKSILLVIVRAQRVVSRRGKTQF